jgi:Pyruvate/2-oxoacid:ferredoxin oxidoreductase delta subunit
MRRERAIVVIDQEKCDGCGLCIPSCAEGALRIVDGKVRLVGDVYCDGVGNCLGECPRGALSIEVREADEFDVSVMSHAADRALAPPAGKPPLQGCPGAAARALAGRSGPRTPQPANSDAPAELELRNWPVQLALVPTQAPYFRGAKLLFAADCVPFAFASFHEHFLAGRRLAIGCPKLDGDANWLAKIEAILASNDIASVEVLHMEVPCCHGLVRAVTRALEATGKAIPATAVEITLDGEAREPVALARMPAGQLTS